VLAASGLREACPFSDTFAETGPADFGAKITLNDALWPGTKVTGSVIPLNVNAALVADAWATVTVDCPVFVKVAACA
jgi:hypothetical protein